ncbi:MAG TPA: IS21 family transposase [Kofleriaceae bacterium]|nr:IS21 family transposase [Kofleriaceae bacterium]
MEEMSKHGRISDAARKADMHRETARKYVTSGKLPSEMAAPRDWRTRPDPFEEHWPAVEARLRATPELEAKTVFELLQEEHPGRYEEGQLRTLQRRIKQWRAAHGPERAVVFGQQHRPGEAAQTDFTHATELAITIAGQVFVHLLCVVVLPYSNWQWATVCLSESMAALRKGVQRALFQLGRVPAWHQTDNSTAATHRIPDGHAVVVEGDPRARPFNDEYVALMKHFGMKPRTTEVGAKEQNGDVEASNGAIKRRLEQALLVRGSRDFDSVEAWQAFVDQSLRKANANRGPRVAEDLAAMRELNAAKLPEYVEDEVKVTDWSTIRVKHCAYSVPSRLRGAWVRVRIFEERLEVYFAGTLELACDRLRGRNLRRIDYRHVIWSLVQKPGAFARYVYREEMFPSLAFRIAYDALQAARPGTQGDLAYLRILHLAASTMEREVEAALVLLTTSGAPITVEAVRELVAAPAPIDVPALAPAGVDLSEYDALLVEPEVAA